MKRLAMVVLAGLAWIAPESSAGVPPAHAAGAHQPGTGSVATDLTPEEKMRRRFPQPVKAGDLIGLPVLDDYDLTIGYVRDVVRTSEGRVVLVVSQGGWLGPWLDVGVRLVPVPIEVVAILGRQLAALDMSRAEFATAKTWSPGDGRSIKRTELIQIAVARR